MLMKSNKKIKTAIVVILLIAIIGAAVGIYMYNKKPAKVEDLKGEVVTVSTLYESDSVFNSKYLGETLIVTGTIVEKSQNQDSTLMIVLEGDNADEVVQCSMRERREAGEIGEKLTVKGICSDKNMFVVLLTGCIVMK